MHYIVSYTLTAERTKENTAALMALFGERGTNDSTDSHWVYADGGGGFLIVDSTGMDILYRDSIAYGAWMDLSATPIISIEDAVPEIMSWLNG